MPVTAAEAPPVHCVLSKSADGFTGACGPIADETPVMTLAPAAAIATGAYRSDAQPATVWSGTAVDENYPKGTLELEAYADGTGILRTLYGWFPIANMRAASSSLAFDIDAAREAAPSDIDEKIVRRASELLSTDAVWNRADNRDCPPDAKSWSTYCAMIRATVDVTGAFHHRRPAMQAVRAAVDDRTAGRNYQHRLMDYNNDPTTRRADVQSLFAETLAGMRDPAWLARHGFAAR